MKNAEIVQLRLIHQQIAGTAFKKPQQIVNWMVAMQAQEFAMAKWAIGLRLPGSVETDIEKAFNEGSILRTHLMRPTWHFVSPADIRWLLTLTAPRINAISAYYFRKTELDNKVFKKCNDSLAKALEGGKQLTRTALNVFLNRAKIKAEGLRLSYIFMRAELDGIVCSGARQGKQFTYALLDERVPPVASLDREEVLANFVKRYFITRGPASLQDFVYWSGLTMKDAKEGMAMVKSHFRNETINGNEHFISKDSIGIPKKIDSKFQSAFLMPDYDEYGMSYKDRSAFANNNDTALLTKGGNANYKHIVIADGIFAGTWQLNAEGKTKTIQTNIFPSTTKKTKKAIEQAVKRYELFLRGGKEK